LVCEEWMTLAEIQNALLVFQISKSAPMMKPQMQPKKNGKHCTNCGQDNHNVETCRVRRKKNHYCNNKGYQSTLKWLEKYLICLPHVWFKWP
jgi:hypothetical protein